MLLIITKSTDRNIVDYSLNLISELPFSLSPSCDSSEIMPLLRLPAEVLSHIFSYDCLTPHDLYQLILTCRRTYDIGILSLYRRVCISARPNQVIPGKSIITNMKGFSDCVDQQPALASLVHAAELYLETDCPGRTNRLLGLLSRFTSIKTLTLAGAYG